MSSIDRLSEVPESDPQPQAGSARQRAKRILTGFAASTIVGLFLAGWYVGTRIMAAEKTHAAAITKPAAPTPKPAPVVPAAEPVPVTAVPVTPAPIAEAKAVEPEPQKVNPVEQIASDPVRDWKTVNPQSGEHYLQLAAMGPQSTTDFLKMLDGKGIRPAVAPGPATGLYRILIGPYPDNSALEREQQTLQAEGIETFVRSY